LANAKVNSLSAVLLDSSGIDTVCYGARKIVTAIAKGGVKPYSYSMDGVLITSWAKALLCTWPATMPLR